jgi:hypothetical protein
MEQLNGNTFTSQFRYAEGTQLVAFDGTNEHVVEVTVVGQWGILWKHVVKIIDEKFKDLY